MTDATVETKIWLALKNRVDDLPDMLDMPLSLPNENLNSPPKRYIRVSYIPNVPSRFLQGSTDPVARYGVLQFMLMTELNKPVDVATNLAGRIAEHFPQDLPMRYDDVTVRVRQTPSVGQTIPSTAYAETPVSVQYTCFAR